MKKLSRLLTSHPEAVAILLHAEGSFVRRAEEGLSLIAGSTLWVAEAFRLPREGPGIVWRAAIAACGHVAEPRLYLRYRCTLGPTACTDTHAKAVCPACWQEGQAKPDDFSTLISRQTLEDGPWAAATRLGRASARHHLHITSVGMESGQLRFDWKRIQVASDDGRVTQPDTEVTAGAQT